MLLFVALFKAFVRLNALEALEIDGAAFRAAMRELR
jgi:hypothetical protein